MNGDNRLQTVAREWISGHIEGVYFGDRLQVIARSPAWVLLWSPGVSYSVNGFRRYGEAHMTGVPRRKSFRYHPDYVRVRPDGGRLSWQRIMDANDRINDFFPDDALAIADAVCERKTLLIEGGGPPLMPTIARVGRNAFNAWVDLPARGLLGDQHARTLPSWSNPSHCHRLPNLPCFCRTEIKRSRCGNYRPD